MPKPENITIKRTLFATLVKAARLGARDSRRDDRVLHDETREALQQADDAARDFLDARSGVV